MQVAIAIPQAEPAPARGRSGPREKRYQRRRLAAGKDAHPRLLKPVGPGRPRHGARYGVKLHLGVDSSAARGRHLRPAHLALTVQSRGTWPPRWVENPRVSLEPH